MNKKVSVITAVYNCERYLPKCLESLLNQTYSDLEIIMIDDGSSDGSSAICDDYARRFDKIRVFHQNNAGPGMARNVGLDHMTGRYLTFVDADDYVAKNYIETMVRLLEDYKADIAEVGLVWMGQIHNIFENSDGEIKCFEGSDILIRDYFSPHRQLRNCVGGRMYDIEKFRNVRFSKKSIGEDSEFSLKMLSKCERLVKYHKCLYGYRAYQESLTRDQINPKQFDVVEVSFNDLSLAERLGIELDDWEYIFQRFIQMCYGLLEKIAVQKKERCFSHELDHMCTVFWKMNELAQKHGVEMSTELIKDINHIDSWANEYRKKNRIKIMVQRFKGRVLHLAGSIKVKWSYEYKFSE